MALINYGSDAGKAAVIVDVIDHNRALIDGPTSGVARQSINFKRLSLTNLKVAVPHSAKAKALKKCLKANDVIAKWKASSWAKNLEKREKRNANSDFDRFKLMVLKKRRRTIVSREVAKLRKQK